MVPREFSGILARIPHIFLAGIKSEEAKYSQ
jgi:hypothetical protein